MVLYIIGVNFYSLEDYNWGATDQNVVTTENYVFSKFIDNFSGNIKAVKNNFKVNISFLNYLLKTIIT